MSKCHIIFTLFVMLLPSLSYAAGNNNLNSKSVSIKDHNMNASDYPSDEYLQKEDEDKKNEQQKIISDYKKYLSDIKPAVIEEIRAYRKEIVKINKQKKDLFQALSQEAQRYLAKEADVKRKLPINNSDID